MNKKYLILHSFGVGCVSTSVVLQILTLWSLCTTGRFVGVEQNTTILTFEVFMTIYAVIYLVYLFCFRLKDEF